MKCVQTAVLLVVSMVTSSMSMQYYQTRIASSDVGCYSGTCGINSRCSLTPDGRPVCACLNLHRGDPLGVCEKVECSISDDCFDNQVCERDRCVNPCATVCGINAHCSVRNHITSCYCPPDHTGDPFTKCTYDPQAPCKTPHICGANAKCEVINGTPTCSCLPGFTGSGIAGCRHECETDYECGAHRNCQNFRCENPCLSACGSDAHCEVINHRAICSCPKGWLGNAYTSCRPECQSHSECPSNKPACFYQKCVNPCESNCGTHANCELQGIAPVCSCPKDRTGDPFTYCRPLEDRDLCHPNPCGLNADCTPGHDNITGEKRPVCTCRRGYIGNNAVFGCQRAECIDNSECPHDKACINYACANPCTGQECGINAVCQPRKHLATCICSDGDRGDALHVCNPITEGRGSRYIRYYK